MSSSAAHVFTDLSVGKKLMCGFALVLLLTVAVTASGFWAVQAVLNGYATTRDLSQIDAQVLQASRAERDFALRQQADAAARVHEYLDSVTALVAQQLKHAAAEDRSRLQTMNQAILDYRQQFDAFVMQQGNARAARQQMGEAAREARDQFDVIELDMYDAVRELRLAGDKLRGSDPLTLAETASGLSKRMLDLRGYESQFIIEGSAEALEEWTYINDDLQTVARSLMVWMDDEQNRSIETALQDAAWQVQQTDRGLVWRAPQGSGLPHATTEPDASLPLRLLLQLLGPLAPDHLL
jgi:methyl-accepting chemotaxis protein